MTAQHIINSIEFARKSHQIHGTIANSQLVRVKDLLASVEGSLDWRLSGEVSADQKLKLNLSLVGEIVVPCQRCLEPMKLPLDIESSFILVKDEADIPEDADDSDDFDYLVANAELDVMQLVEDEVLLAIPYAPKHDAKDCPVGEALGDSKKPNPFAVLRDFKVVKN